jgi:prevent-host-death family protein
MNIVALREAKSKLTEVGQRAQRGRRALVTRRGKPFFVILGVEGEDLIDVLIRWDPDFWRDLEARRKRAKKRSISLEDFESKVASAVRPAAAAKPRRRSPR